jgi:signal transduction histidine kinase
LTSRTHPDDVERSVAAYEASLAARAPFHVEMRLQRHDGQFRWIESSALPRLSPAGELLGYVGASPDITSRKIAEQVLRESEAQAQRAVEARDEFLSIAAHELRNPLNALQLQLVGLLRATGDSEGAVERKWVRDRVGHAVGDVGSLVRLVHNLLDVARITGGRLNLELEDVDLTALIRTVVNRFRQQLGDRQVVLELQAVTGRWDRLRLDQIVANLVSNAIKYGDGKPIEISLASDAGLARLMVRDHGIGIEPAQQRRLFERFERGVPRRQYGGFGLGLWITRETVAAMRGTIALDSRPGHGSTFTVELPLTPPPISTSSS